MRYGILITIGTLLAALFNASAHAQYYLYYNNPQYTYPQVQFQQTYLNYVPMYYWHVPVQHVQSIQQSPVGPASLDPVLPVAAGPSTEDAIHSEPAVDCRSGRECGPRYWADAEYLLWWVKDAPLGIPLLSTGPTFGLLNEPGAQVLYGEHDQGFGNLSGGRVSIGSWVNDSNRIGLEIGGFLTERRTGGISLTSNDNPILLVPFFDPGVFVTGENGISLANVNLAPGAASISNHVRLGGVEATGLFNLYRGNSLSIDLLGGFRYLRLHENLQLTAVRPETMINPDSAFLDSFATRNQFYGGDLGCRIRLSHCQWSLDFMGKVALGVIHQVVAVTGASQNLTTGQLFPGGIFAQPSNSGARSNNDFTAIPEVRVALGCQLTPRLRATVGYTFLYLDHVVRPGDQLDRVVNLQQNGVFGTGVTVPDRPSPMFNDTDFWAHGLSFGLECRW